MSGGDRCLVATVSEAVVPQPLQLSAVWAAWPRVVAPASLEAFLQLPLVSVVDGEQYQPSLCASLHLRRTVWVSVGAWPPRPLWPSHEKKRAWAARLTCDTTTSSGVRPLTVNHGRV
jgi:hypothetical protein